MTKKQKQDFYEAFAEAFHDVVMPLLENMATKDDLKNFATKDDLKREIGFVRQDINDLRAEVSTSPSRSEFEDLKTKVNRLTN